MSHTIIFDDEALDNFIMNMTRGLKEGIAYFCS